MEEIDLQPHRQTNKTTNGQTNTQTNGQRDKFTKRHINKQTYKLIMNWNESKRTST